MAQIGYKGESLDLLIRQGGTFGPHTITWTNPDGSPVDITDMVFRGQIRKTYDSPLISANLNFEVVNAIGGVFKFWIDAVQTANIPAGPTEDSPESQYFWDMESEDPSGIVVPLIYGNVKVFREITK